MKTPYTSNSNRLANVIAAIQVLGTYKFYKLDFSDWAERIEGDNSKGEYWKNIFIEHPEFFRINNTCTKASLVWRRNHPKRYNVDSEESITKEQFDHLKGSKQMERISRSPLSNEDVKALINSAISLHNNELNQKRDRRWWIPVLVGFIGIIVGVLLEKFL